jgi:hypothetical protein
MTAKLKENLMSNTAYPALSLLDNSSAFNDASRRCPAPLLSVAVDAGEDPQSIDNKLSNAVNRLIPAALERRQGILVTQHRVGHYTVEVDADVPCGAIHELRC